MMFKFFRSLFAVPENGSQIITGVKEGLDALFFTNEEKAQHASEAFKLYLEWIKATQGHNVSRRFLAVVVALLWTFLVLLTVLVKIVEITLGWMEGASEFVFTVLTDVVALPFAGVMAFYFATQLLQRSIGAAKNGN